MELPIPPVAVTVMAPVLAPAGTVTVSFVSEFTVNAGAFVPLKLTRVVPVKFVPVRTTTAPGGPIAGVNDVIAGGGITTKLIAETAVLTGVVTAIGPVMAPAGTMAVICVAELTVNTNAAVPLKST